MNYTHPYNFRLVSRNEGKIKSYDSCCDIRAWSHDVGAKDRYLREWIKCNMPLYVIPVSTLTNFVRTMTCRNHRRVPRCHPECKSKVLVESICNSCHAIRECFETNDFEKYVVEEELESSQWPCDRCLDALKSIKMFWKIIVDKIFHVKIPKYDESHFNECCDRDTVKSVAGMWQSEIVSQAYYVKSMTTPVIGGVPWPNRDEKKSSQNTVKTWSTEDRYSDKKVRQSHLPRLQRFQEEKDKQNKGFHKNLDRSTHAAAIMADKSCDTYFLEKEQNELDLCKKNLVELHTKCIERANEIERLRRENKSLRIELENVYSSGPWGASYYSDPDRRPAFQPFELEESPQPMKVLESEMVITMKQCKNENFKHVSVLQVLHKSNDPNNEPKDAGGKKDDPIDILKKVQNKFGAIVKRELCINMDRRLKHQVSDIEGSFRTVRPSTSTRSCSTLCSKLSSELVFLVGNVIPIHTYSSSFPRDKRRLSGVVFSR